MSNEEKGEIDRRSILNNVESNYERTESEKSPTSERRSVLKGFAISIGAALGLSGTAAANPGHKMSDIRQKAEAARDGYETPTDVNKALDKHGNSVITELLERGHLESEDVADLRADSVEIQKAPDKTDPTEGTYLVASEHEGKFISHISFVKKKPLYDVRVNVQPQLDRSFATVKTRDGDLVTAINPSAGEASSLSTNGDVTIQKSCGREGYTCPPGPCCSTCDTAMTKHERICCVLPDGSIDCYTQPINECCLPSSCC